MRKTIARELMKKVKDDYAIIASEFDNTRKHGWTDFEVFDGFLKDGIKVLDIGCGNGRLKDYLESKANIEYYGVDNNEKFIEIAKKRNGNFEVGDFLNLPYPDNYFDLVLSVAAFHHIPSDFYRSEALKEVSRVMKPKSTGIFLVWNLFQKKYRKLRRKSLLRFWLSFGKYGLHDLFVPWANKANRYYYAFTKNKLIKTFKDFKVLDLDLTTSKKNYYIIFQADDETKKQG